GLRDRLDGRRNGLQGQTGGLRAARNGLGGGIGRGSLFQGLRTPLVGSPDDEHQVQRGRQEDRDGDGDSLRLGLRQFDAWDGHYMRVQVVQVGTEPYQGDQ